MNVIETSVSITNPNAPIYVRNSAERDVFALKPSLWLDASGDYFEMEGNSVRAWCDRVSGLRYINNFTAPTVVAAGSTKAANMIGISTMKPEGGEKLLPASGSYSTVIVARVPEPGSGGGALISGRAPAGAVQPPVVQATRYDATIFDVSSGGTGVNGLTTPNVVNNNAWQVITVSIRAGAAGRSVIRLNGVEVNNLVGPIGTLSETSRELLVGGALGQNLGGGNGFEQLLAGQLGLILVFPDLVLHENAAARDLIETYAMGKRAERLT